jgi:hypothetical protein
MILSIGLSYRDSPQFPTGYLSPFSALGFVALETKFGFVDVLAHAIAEICSCDA